MVFILKARRALLGTVKDFRPISLTSFILKLMERLVDRYIREVPFTENPLCREQHAYQEGKSSETALADAALLSLFCSTSRALSIRMQGSMMLPIQWKGGCGAC